MTLVGYLKIFTSPDLPGVCEGMQVVRRTRTSWPVALQELFDSLARGKAALPKVGPGAEGDVPGTTKPSKQYEECEGQQRPFTTGGTSHLLSLLTGSALMIGLTRRPVCPRFVPDLGHDLVVDNGKRDRAEPSLRMSVWLPPGLALGWLALLATFVHGVGALLAAWATTVSLAVLLARGRADTSPGDRGEADRDTDAPDDDTRTSSGVSPSTPSGGDDEPRDSTTSSADLADNAATTAPRGPDAGFIPSPSGESTLADRPPRVRPGDVVSGPSRQTEQLATKEIIETLGIRVLTADEVASVLRVNAKVIVAAISNGELPGNRIGTHWRVDYGALTRWLQGKYGIAADSHGSTSPAELRAGPS